MELRVPKAPFQATNQYVVRERIGAGGMGTVFRAFDSQLRRDVALKVLNQLDHDSLERFVREREITADLDHPTFVRILSMGYLQTNDGRRPFYTMPLLRGETLAELVARRSLPDAEGGRLREEFTQRRLVQLVQQLCQALESAHARGIVHRDLKPANIILGPYGELYIVDLGLAKYVNEEEPLPPALPSGDDQKDPELTAQAPAGTPFYSAPEQILDPNSVDARTDIFGLGAILYFVLTGRHPLYRTTAATDAARPQPEGGARTRRGPATDRGSGVPQWSDPPADPAGDSSVIIRALHGNLLPPDEVVGGDWPDEDGRPPENEAFESVDPALSAICAKALARKAEDRYGSCRAMWRELQQVLEGQAEMIYKREAAELTRTMTRRTVPLALRDFERAEERLRQRIAQKETVGRLAIEEKLDLLDLLLEKATIFERRGDTDTIIRSITRAEPIIESTLEVLNRQFIRLLIARGAALTEREDAEAAKEILSKAIALAQGHKMEDLLASACGLYGAACGRSDEPKELEVGRAALAASIKSADRAGDKARGVRSRIDLARLQLRPGGEPSRARSRLDEALRLAGDDPVLQADVHAALGEYHLARREPGRAESELRSAMEHAQKADARNTIRETHFLLGQASHARGDSRGREEHFRQAMLVRGPRRAAMERRIARFLGVRPAEPQPAGPARPKR